VGRNPNQLLYGGIRSGGVVGGMFKILIGIFMGLQSRGGVDMRCIDPALLKN